MNAHFIQESFQNVENPMTTMTTAAESLHNVYVTNILPSIIPIIIQLLLSARFVNLYDEYKSDSEIKIIFGRQLLNTKKLILFLAQPSSKKEKKYIQYVLKIRFQPTNYLKCAGIRIYYT